MDQLFRLDLDDLNVGAYALLSEYLSQTSECLLVRWAVFVKEEPDAHQKPFGFAYYSLSILSHITQPGGF